MSIEHTLASQSAVMLAPGEGERLEFLNNLATIKLVGGDDGLMSVVEFLAPQGFGPPEHSHEHEDELFIITEGSLAFFTGGERWETTAGGFAFLPRAVPHTFQVLSESARLINVTASVAGAPQFDRMVSALGSPTDRLTIPEPAYIDPAQVAEVCHVHGIEIVGPPPGPLG